jgi:hypothetical protein
MVPVRSFNLRDRSLPPPNAARRKVSFKADTRLETFAHRIVPPNPGGPTDPRLGGATLTLYNSSTISGHPTDTVTVMLAAANWIGIGSGSITGYRYTGPDPLNGPIKQVVVKGDVLSIRGGKTNWGYTLDEPQQGGVGVRLTLADGSGWCADVPPKVTATLTKSTDKQDKFVGQPRSPAAASCPALP